jgi:hypothetical protein
MNRLMRCFGIGTMAVAVLVPAAGAADAEVLEDDGSAATANSSCSANRLVVLRTFSPMARRRAMAMIGIDATIGPAADMVLDAVQDAVRSVCE